MESEDSHSPAPNGYTSTAEKSKQQSQSKVSVHADERPQSQLHQTDKITFDRSTQEKHRVTYTNEENDDLVRLEDLLANDRNFHRSQNACELRQMIEEAELEEDEPIEEEK